MSAGGGGGSNSGYYVDPWQEYKQIRGKLKKRNFLLRKPNVAEAVREFANLTTRFEEEECKHYAGLCQLNIASCERNVSLANELAGLKNAARLFMEVEMDKKKLSLPSFGHNLTSAINGYCYAVKLYAEQKQFGQAGNLCVELAINLMKIDRCYESVEYFDKAYRFYKNQPINEVHALQWLCVAYVANGEYHNALKTLERTKSVVLSLCEDKLKPVGVWSRYLADVEIGQILLITAIGPQKPQRLSEDETNMKLKYSTVNDVFVPQETYLDSDSFSLLQCFVLAVEENDCESCDVCLTDLRPYLKPFLLDLGFEIVNSVKSNQLSE